MEAAAAGLVALLVCEFARESHFRDFPVLSPHFRSPSGPESREANSSSSAAVSVERYPWTFLLGRRPPKPGAGTSRLSPLTHCFRTQGSASLYSDHRLVGYGLSSYFRANRERINSGGKGAGFDRDPEVCGHAFHRFYLCRRFLREPGDPEP